jgi:hypothetical protein
MGADVAASPHCPCASDPAWEAKAFRAGRFRGAVPEPKPEPASSGVPATVPKRDRRFPRGLPDRAEALAVRRLADSEPKFVFLPWHCLRPKPLTMLPAGSPAEARVPPGGPWTEILGSADFAAPGPKPGPARPFRNRSPFPSGGVAPTEVPLSAGQVPDRSPFPACPVPPARRLSVPVGAFEACRFRIR